MKSPLQKTRAALKRSRQNLAKLTSSKRDAAGGLPVFEADTYARSPSESSLTKAKRSDYNLKELSESSDEEEGRHQRHKADAKGRRSWALVLVAAACLGGAGYAATRSAKPMPVLHADRSLRTATDLFRKAATADGLRSAEFTRATDALNPFLEALVRARVLCLRFRGDGVELRAPSITVPSTQHLGLAPLVRVNVVKLQNAGAEKTQDSIETLVRAERRAGTDDEDASVSVAVLWNGRILRLCERLIRDVVKSDAPMPQLAHRAYKTTLEPHHNWIMRSGARALLRLTPDRRTLFETRLGYEADGPALRADLEAFAAAVRACVDRLDALFRAADSRERL